MHVRGLIAFLLAAVPAATASAGQGGVVVTSIEGPLAESMIATLERAVRHVEEIDADVLLVEIDTPGGEVQLMERLGRVLDRCPAEPVALVVGEAVSAGAYIALSCERIYTLEHAQIGSSYPIAFPTLAPGGEGTDPGVQEKILSYLRSKFRDRAQGHDRPGLSALAEAMVDPSVEVLLVRVGRDRVPMTRREYEDLRRTPAGEDARIEGTICAEGKLLNLTAKEAFDYGLTDGIVGSRKELLDALGYGGSKPIEVRPNWSERLVGALEHSQWLLLVAGLVLLYVELKIPGFGVPGTLGLLCLGLVLFRNWLVGLAEMPEILLIAAGFALLAVEIFVIPGFGVAGIAGLTCVSLGLLFSFLPFFVPDGPVEAGMFSDTIASLGLALLSSIVLLIVVSRFLPRLPLLGRLVLATTPMERGSALVAAGEDGGALPVPGRSGVARTPLRPAGKVEIDGALLDALTEGEWIDAGRRVEVVRREANRVVVRPAAAGAKEG